MTIFTGTGSWSPEDAPLATEAPTDLEPADECPIHDQVIRPGRPCWECIQDDILGDWDLDPAPAGTVTFSPADPF